MIISAHQPAYLPWLGFFHKIALSDIFIILDSVQYSKGSFVNRNKIKTSTGEAWITVPIETKGNFTASINEMKVSKINNWEDKHIKTIHSNYKRAKYYKEHIDFFRSCHEQNFYSLCDILNYQLDYFLTTLGLKQKIYYLSSLNIQGKKQELILNICKYFDADKFIFGQLGINYAGKDYFNSSGIEIYFQKYNHPIYNQLWGEFIPYMSIIDLLFNEGKDKALDIIMQNNEAFHTIQS